MTFKALRKSAGYTQVRLAEVSGVTAATISHIERGVIQSSHYATVVKLAQALKTSAADVAAAIAEQHASKREAA